MSLLFNLFYSVLFVFLSLETFFYQGFIQKHFFLNPYTLLQIYILLSLIIFFFIKPNFNRFILKINSILLLFSTVFYFLFFYLEKFTYKNFVFTHTHLNFQLFIYIIIFSFSTFYFSKTPQNILKKIFYLVPPLLLIFFLAFEKYNRDLFIIFIQEDGIVEYVQFIFYSLASILFFKSIKKSKHFFKKIYIILFIFSFFIAGEEISWGQRILGIETPESYKQINHQDETTIHNLEFIQFNLLHNAYIFVGLIGTFSYLFFKKFLPNSKFIVFCPDKFLFFGFFLTFIFYFSYDYFLIPNEITFGTIPLVRWQEVAETFLSISFFGHSFNIYQNLANHSQKRKSSEK